MSSLEAELRGRAVAVYGGTGLIGTALVRLIRQLRLAAGDGGTQDIVIGRSPVSRNSRWDGVQYLNGSVLDKEFVAHVPRTPLAVYLAGSTSNYLDDASTTIRLSTESFANVLARDHEAGVVFISSGRIYGPRHDEQPLDESSPTVLLSPDSRNIYDASKLIAESLAAMHARAGGRVVIVRPGNVYGPAGTSSATNAWSQMVADAGFRGRIVLHGSTGSLRNWVHCDDVAAGITAALCRGHSGEAYNIGSSEHVTSRRFAEAIAECVNEHVTVEIGDPLRQADHMVLSIAKAERALGYRPVRTLREALPTAVRAELARNGTVQ